jgi:hypothetical protein
VPPVIGAQYVTRDDINEIRKLDGLRKREYAKPLTQAAKYRFKLWLQSVWIQPSNSHL